MDARRRLKSLPPRSPTGGENLKTQKPTTTTTGENLNSQTVSLCVANAVFFGVFFSVAYFLLHRWREKIRTETPLHVVTVSETAAIVSLIASAVYLLGFFGIGSRTSFPDDLSDEEILAKEDSRKPGPCPAALVDNDVKPPPVTPIVAPVKIYEVVAPVNLTPEDEEIAKSVVTGSIPSYSLESRLADCRKAAAIRRSAVQTITGKSLEGLPLEGFDYDSILGQCCEMPIGFVQIPVGVAGPLLLDGVEYTVPMATTEGCLVASTNRGCKAIHVSGGASSVLLRDGMTRAPVVRFSSAKRAAELKFFLEDPLNFDTLAVTFNKYGFFSFFVHFTLFLVVYFFGL